jgi:glucose/arabinose dehydrogenase
MRARLPALVCLLALPLSSPSLAQPVADAAPNVPENTPAFPEQTEAPERITEGYTMTPVAEGLAQPWAVAVLPGDAGYLVTERGGTLRHVGRGGTVSAPLAGVPEVRAQRQGGLLDVALAPDFAETRVIYLTYAAPAGIGRSVTAAARAVLGEDLSTLADLEVIFEQTPPSVAPAHFGSRVQPLPDGSLAITTGDRFVARDLAQDISASYGVVARVMPDGTVPVDNPFVGVEGALPEVYSHGHRNVQGAAVQPETGALWTIEHGPAGGDELNFIVPGGNYGWPVVSYGVNYNGSDVGSGEATHAPDFIEPRYYWDPVIAPGGMVFYEGEMFPEWQGDLLIGGLVAMAVVRLQLDGTRVVAEERLVDGFDRVRDVAIDHDGSVLYVTGHEDGMLARITRD